MKKEKTIELIKKVLAKTKNNNNENEVQLALMKAQELMVKHNISMEDIEVGTTEKEVSTEYVTEKNTNWYMKQLGLIICENFKCKAIVTNTSNGKKRVSKLTFIGIKEDVEIAKEVFICTLKSLEYIAEGYVKRVRCKDLTWERYYDTKHYIGIKNDYIKGFLNGLDSKYKEQVKKNEWGLVIVTPKEVNEYMDTLNLNRARKTTIHTSGVTEHYNKGYKDGKTFEHKKELIG